MIHPPRAITTLTVERANELLSYDPDTGRLTWAITRGGYVKQGAVAGCQRPDGYWVIRIDGVLYLSHRVVWLIMTGAWPDDEVDHRFGDTGDMRWEKLRGATHAQNITNQSAHKDNKIGHKGIRLNKNGRYYVTVNNKSRGGHTTLQEAIFTRDSFLMAEFGEFARS